MKDNTIKFYDIGLAKNYNHTIFGTQNYMISAIIKGILSSFFFNFKINN